MQRNYTLVILANMYQYLMKTSFPFETVERHGEFLQSLTSYSKINILVEKSILQTEKLKDKTLKLFTPDHDEQINVEKGSIQTGEKTVDSHPLHLDVQ